MGRAGGPPSTWSVTLRTGKEEIGALCREGTPQKITEKVILALREGKILLLFLLSKAEGIEAVHIYVYIHTHIFHSRRNKHTEFSAIAIWHI